jgi:predicted dehydrogenase
VDTETSTASESSTAAVQQTIPVGIIGFGWMGRVHAQAYSRVRHYYPHLAQIAELVAIADDVPGLAAEAARQFGARLQSPTGGRWWTIRTSKP